MKRWLFFLCLSCCSVPTFGDAKIEGDSKLDVTVGVTGYVKQVVLPGSELKVREVDPRRTPIALRIDKVYPHGDDFRYDLTFFGLEPGNHNLSEYLARKDDTSVEDLPKISVTVNSILPKEQFVPSPPPQGFIARIGGYYVAMILAIVGWIGGLLAILFWRRDKSDANKAFTSVSTVNEVDQIKLLVDQAIDAGELSDRQKADLDMRVLTFWRARRNITNLSVAEALIRLKTDEQAGPLLTGLERWFYSREAPTKDEIVSLLKPMSDIANNDAATRQPVAAGEVV